MITKRIAAESDICPEILTSTTKATDIIQMGGEILFVSLDVPNSASIHIVGEESFLRDLRFVTARMDLKELRMSSEEFERMIS